MQWIRDYKVWDGESAMKAVRVIMEDPSYNYTTSVSDLVTEEEAKKYFVSKAFNFGDTEEKPYDIMVRCVSCEMLEATQ